MSTLIRTVCLTLLAFLALINRAPAEEAEEAASHWPILSTEELRVLKQGGSEFLLVDVLPKIMYDEAHIPGSSNIPLGSIRTTPHLPKDKNTLLIFYCMGVACIYSGKAAHAAYEIGYRNLRVYREGIVGWQRAGLPVESTVHYPAVEVPLISARQLSDGTDAFLLDIRPADHFARGHIKGSTNIDIEVLHDKIHLLPQDQRIVLIDNKGKLPLTTGRFLASKGLKNVLRLDGGFNAWVKAGLPVEQASGLTGLSQCDRCEATQASLPAEPEPAVAAKP
jgi:rhodanese-related sulfurtransferase